MSTRLEQRVLAKTASYTILGTIDSPGTRFTNRGAGGAVTFTLPPPSLNVKGHWYEFEIHADQTVIVAGHTTGKLATVGNAAADNVSYAVASNKIGRKIYAACDGTQWFAWGIGEGFCVNGTQIAPTVAELAAFIGLSISAAELGFIDGVTAGTAAASKALVLGTSKQVDTVAMAAPILGTTATEGSATQMVAKIVKKAVADNAATAVFTVTVPNANHAAAIRITLLASIAAVADQFESSRVATGTVVIARTTGANAVAVVSTIAQAQIATVAGGETVTLAYGVSAIAGAVGAANTFDVTVTIVRAGGTGTHQVVAVAELINAEATGVTLAAA